MSISYSPFVFAGGGSADIQMTISDSSTLPQYAFRPSGTVYGQMCKSVKAFRSKTLTIIGAYGLNGMDVLEELELPNLTSLGDYALAASTSSAGSSSPLKVIDLPKLQGTGVYAFRYRSTLESVTLGSVGNPVARLATTAFSGCTQSTLSIIIYTEDGSELSGSPWGATNANIEFRAA